MLKKMDVMMVYNIKHVEAKAIDGQVLVLSKNKYLGFYIRSTEKNIQKPLA